MAHGGAAAAGHYVYGAGIQDIVSELLKDAQNARHSN